ncbi:hypothetical protein [Streptomyces formicae]|uniref:Allene oxide cyclase barrel-like domain-containing protein n=1 Tax=Streptomyces formicae TaxID=1616117 RepID=A0ABY3WMZ6_9ACTN|nr:hypothetical protein [Streptomyces formicae]UNM12956.1 hypothetical protein J4032_16805 [Streptomyces formicae]
MLSISKWAVAAATTALSLATLAGSASASNDAHAPDRRGYVKRTEVIRLTSTGTGTTVVDNGAPGRGIGDQIIITANLFRRGISYGTEGAVCTRVAPDTTLCTGTFRLPLGQVTWQHLQTTRVGTPPSDFDLAVTGGTGSYATARGYGHVEAISQSGGALTLYLAR